MTSKWLVPALLGILCFTPSVAGAQPAQALSPPGLSSDELEAFAVMVNDDPAIVEQRLLWDPALGPLAKTAMEAGVKRRRTGLVLTVAGFGTAIVGLVVGGVVWASGIRLMSDCPYEGGSNCESPGNDEGTMRTGKTIMVVATVAGILAGIPGVVLLRTPAQAEDDVVARYRTGVRWRPAVFPPSRSLPDGIGKTVGLPLLSVRF